MLQGSARQIWSAEVGIRLLAVYNAHHPPVALAKHPERVLQLLGYDRTACSGRPRSTLMYVISCDFQL